MEKILSEKQKQTIKSAFHKSKKWIILFSTFFILKYLVNDGFTMPALFSTIHSFLEYLHNL